MNINSIVTFGSDKCCGCTACYSVCPKHCISMSCDDEGFLYPVVDEEKCINCEQCLKICPFHNPYEDVKPKEVLAAYNKDQGVRLKSSSGGIFMMMAKKVIREGGVVFGAKFTDDWQVEITSSETLEGLAAFFGSKYVQARVGDSYNNVKSYLMQKRKVLFSGTPCQIAGLKHYLHRDYDNLMTVDIVCHGVPSPKVWNLYLTQVTEAGKKAIRQISFRNKQNGWKRFNFSLTYNENDKTCTISSFNGDNHYMRAFLSNLILRPSCYNCQAKCGRSNSDITIADFWGVNRINPKMDDDKGTSLLLIHSEKGKQLLDFSKMKYTSASYRKALKYNSAIEKSVKTHKNRADFFDHLDSTIDIIDLINKELKPTTIQKIRIQYYEFRHKVKVLLLHFCGGGDYTKAKEQASIPFLKGDYKIRGISFRNKSNGWKNYKMVIILKHSKTGQ